ncbi:T9SS type A sorting domain-containing protein [uncultured Psychroserpens sp.]|uniref:T9SS type A sorting domain-containing protein n=1 Tax=uncultured Psychroserpens sp. TaxID=255436 RepID=UPI002608BCD3|nr:T9SS type A sorting domain-containing protein [uncultured Psychroserpens sp.]
MKTKIKYLLILFGISANAQLQQETTTYSYDNLNRLVQVVFNDGSTHDYVYDNLGNRTQLNIETLSLDEEVLKNRIIVYPNPTNKILNIQMPTELVSNQLEIQLFDVDGKMILDHNAQIVENSISIDVSRFLSGIYLIHIKSDNKQWSKLFIKK